MGVIVTSAIAQLKELGNKKILKIINSYFLNLYYNSTIMRLFLKKRL